MQRIGVLRAKALRRRTTDAERKFWHAVRDRRLGDFKFKRQVPIGRWVADFACLEAAMVIEIDGGQHVGSKRDIVRDRDLEERGFVVIRFWNIEILQNLPNILDHLLLTLQARAGAGRHGAEIPSPRGGEGFDP